MDPATLINHPSPVRNLILQIPAPLLSTLLTHHAQAYEPQQPLIEKLTPTELKISYLQPLREVWFKPIARTATIRFVPPLSPIPADADENERSAYNWEKEVVARLKEMEKESTLVNEGRSDIVVSRYLPPTDPKSYLAILQFLVLTAVIVCWIMHGEDTPFVGALLGTLFDREWKFNAAVLVHAGILVKKSREMMTMAEKLRRHQVDKMGRIRGPWLKWMVTAGLEGWRCGRRFEEEVGKVGREMAAEKAGKKE